METSNITFTTTGGHEIVMKPFITGFDKLAISEAYLDAKEAQVPDGNGGMRLQTVAEQMRAITRKALELVIISVDGSKEEIYSAIYNLDHRETDEVKKRVDEITDAKKK